MCIKGSFLKEESLVTIDFSLSLLLFQYRKVIAMQRIFIDRQTPVFPNYH